MHASVRLLRVAPTLLRRLTSTVSRPSCPQPYPLPPSPHVLPAPSPGALLAATLAAATTLAALPSDTARAEAPPPLHWPQLLHALRAAQPQSHSPLFAARTRTSAATWRYTLELPASPTADLYAVLTTLAAALPYTFTLHVDESPTRTVVTLAGRGAEVALTVPRVAPFEPRVAVELTRGVGEGVFEADEVEALVRAFAIAQRPGGVKNDEVSVGGLLDGKGAVDVGPRTVLEPRGEVGDRFGAMWGVNENAEDEDEEEGGDGEEERMKVRRARAKLEELGVDVFDGEGSGLTWDALAGYEEVKKRIENTLTLPLRHPDVYESVVRGTRKRFQSNLPKAVLYEGPPGCGKTLSAKILSVSIGVPFVHVPLEAILSKFYGETTRKLAEILQTANQLGPCLVFIDECDSIGLSRSSSTEVHEVTRRTLSVLLRHIDGLDGPQNTILLAATNHKEAIDPALMSRFDVVVSFPLPDLDTRIRVLALYAKHLSEEELKQIAELSGGFSGRELLDVCEEAERSYAGYLVREVVSAEKGEVKLEAAEERLPRLCEYVDAIRRKAPHVVGRVQTRPAPAPRESAAQPMTVGPAPAMAM